MIGVVLEDEEVPASSSSAPIDSRVRVASPGTPRLTWSEIGRFVLHVKLMQALTILLGICIALAYAQVWRMYALERFELEGSGALLIPFKRESGSARVDGSTYYVFFSAALIASLSGWLASAVYIVMLIAGRRGIFEHVFGFTAVCVMYIAYWFGFWSDHYHLGTIPVASYLSVVYLYPPLTVGIQLYRSLRCAGKSTRASRTFAVWLPVLSAGCIFASRVLVLGFAGLSDVLKACVRIIVLPVLSVVFQGLFRELSRVVAIEPGECETYDASAPMIAIQFYIAVMSRLLQSRISDPRVQVGVEAVLLAQELFHIKCLMHKTTVLAVVYERLRLCVMGKRVALVYDSKEHLENEESKALSEHRAMVRTALHSTLIPVTLIQESVAVAFGYIVPIVFNFNMDGAAPLNLAKLLTSFAISLVFKSIIAEVCAVLMCARTLSDDPDNCIRIWPKSSTTFYGTFILAGIGSGLLLPVYLVSLSSCVNVSSDSTFPLLFQCST